MPTLYSAIVSVSINSSDKKFEVTEVFTASELKGSELQAFYQANLRWNNPAYTPELVDFKAVGKSAININSNEIGGNVDRMILDCRTIDRRQNILNATVANDLTALLKEQNRVRSEYVRLNKDMKNNYNAIRRERYALNKLPEKPATIEQMGQKESILQKLDKLTNNREFLKEYKAKSKETSIKIAGIRGSVREARKQMRQDSEVKSLHEKVKNISPEIFSKADNLRQKLENQRMQEIKKERKSSQTAERHKIAELSKQTTKFKAPTLKMK